MSETAAAEMKIDPARASALISQLQGVRERVAAVAQGRPVRIVAVSKLKPANDIQALLSPPASHTHFGENYAQELTAKAALLPRSVNWHFIGGLQSTHCKIARIPNLFCVSSVDTLKKATLLDKYRGEVLHMERLNVHVQVNTSGEASKSGCAPGEETLALCKAIVEGCPNLRLLGLMTIGAIARSKAATSAEEENEDFVELRKQRDMVVREIGGQLEAGELELELSMGMSEDFESAIALGSGEVRVGSTIFGERPARGDAKLVAS
ncbi:hypothetical protein B0T19DRAFT_387305 [Cercophora scortea]|uniref:Pyridoxal phosphate homeostasis protein n=1 Tax=Cercophora scortea TaxID=314031 RepID=A0AAE0M6D0_9PEZI|nr:hypothetical protein B0T19DRAFT_387305 [Cercophora scortea]